MSGSRQLELTNILNHSGARMLLFENDFAPLVEMLRPACREIERFVTLDEKVPIADMTYEELLDKGHPERADIFSYDENAIAELFYTSGSTGTPKGVMLGHRTLYLHAMAVATLCEGRGDHGGSAHHSVVSRQRLGQAAGFHHARASSRSWCGASSRPACSS